jgi:hypothetical protein
MPKDSQPKLRRKSKNIGRQRRSTTGMFRAKLEKWERIGAESPARFTAGFKSLTSSSSRLKLLMDYAGWSKTFQKDCRFVCARLVVQRDPIADFDSGFVYGATLMVSFVELESFEGSHCGCRSVSVEEVEVGGSVDCEGEQLSLSCL